MSQLTEDSDDDVEAGFISSDESGHAADLAERLRVKPSRDIWELGKIAVKDQQEDTADSTLCIHLKLCTYT